MTEQPQLKQTLRGFQIFFIVISGIIGGGIFNNNGEALEVAGPAGLILSVVVMGLISIFVGECISELSQQFPAPNAIVEWVKTFVDEDLGWVIGIAYWYAFASQFANQSLVAANLSTYWDLSTTFQTLAFYAVGPIVILILNFMGVFWFGIVETFGGALKCLLVFGVSILLYVIAAQEGDGSSSGPINDGFENDSTYAKNHSDAVCYAITLVAYSFLGVEIVAMTAFEAKYSTSLKWPSRVIPYFVFILYFFCTIAEALTVNWTNLHLPTIYGGTINHDVTNATNTPPSSSSLAVFGTWQAGHHALAGFLNGALIFSCLSEGNTSLYVSSRTLYGLARDIPDTNWIGKKLNNLSIVVRKTGVPAAALFFSAVSFFWLPFLHLKAGYAIEDLIEIMSVSASISCMVVWAALCIAFIRYEKWLEICDNGLKAQHSHYRRQSPQYKSYTFLSWAQPYIAWLGLIGCVLVFSFTSAMWWSSPANLTKVAIAYAVHILLFVAFIIFKIINRRWWVTLDPDVTVLVKALDRLRWLKQDQRPSEEEQLMHDLAAQAVAPKVESQVGSEEAVHGVPGEEDLRTELR